MAEEEKEEARQARDWDAEDDSLDVAPRDTTPAQYIYLLLEVEDQQYVLFSFLVADN